MKEIAVAVLVAIAFAVVAFSAVGALRARRPLTRLHYLAPVTTIAVPLLCLAAALTEGATLGTATIVLTALVAAFSSPVTSAAVGRTLAEEAGVPVGESPE